MRDMRNVAAEKTMPQRLDPDPARACPAPIRSKAARGRAQRPVQMEKTIQVNGQRPVAEQPIIRNVEMRRRRVKLAEAMREIGLDETKLAETLLRMFSRRSVAPAGGIAEITADKFLIELVKECARMLETTKSAGCDMASEAPTILRLRHNIPRPVRTSSAEARQREMTVKDPDASIGFRGPKSLERLRRE